MKNTLFVLEAVTFTKKRKRHKDDYQPFTIDVSFVSFYKQFEEAEAGMKQLLEEFSSCNFYCFYIRQIPYNHSFYSYNFDNYATWLYDPTGNRIDERLYPSDSFGSYFSGRPKEKLRFHIGDIVEYGGTLGIVISVPKEHYDKALDSSDDCYCVLYLEQDLNTYNLYHAHPECINVMPPRFPITQKVHNQITRVKEWYTESQKEYNKQS